MSDDHRAQPALTKAERAHFEWELADFEQRRWAELQARQSRVESLTQEELDDLIDDMSSVTQHVGELRVLLAQAPPLAAPTPGEMRLHSRVRVQSEDGREQWYRVVLSLESSPAWARDSDVTNVFWGSPIAEALVGRRLGERAVVRGRMGDQFLTIQEVHHEPL